MAGVRRQQLVAPNFRRGIDGEAGQDGGEIVSGNGGRKFHILQGVPKEGAVLAVDNMVIHKSAPRPDLALMFINFMLDGRNSAELTNLIGSGNPNVDARKYIKPELLKFPAIFRVGEPL